MRSIRVVLVVVLVALLAPADALARTVTVPAAKGDVFAVYHRLVRAGLDVRLAALTFTDRAAPRVAREQPRAGSALPAASIVTLTLRRGPHPRAPRWAGRTHRVSLERLVGTRASSVPRIPGVLTRLHLGPLRHGTGPGLLFNYEITRLRPTGGSTITVRQGHPPPTVDVWASEFPAPAYPCDPAPHAQILAAGAQAIVSRASGGQLFACLRANGRPFPLDAYGARVALTGTWLALTTTTVDSKFGACSVRVATVDLLTRKVTPVDGAGCMPGAYSLPVAIDDLAISPDGFAAWRTREITGDAHTLTGIACPSRCVVVDDRGEAAFSQTPLTDWGSGTVQAGTALAGIACPSTTLCVAIDRQGHAFTADPQDGVSAQWRQAFTGLTDQTSVACASTSLCLIVGGNGVVATTTDPASGVWTDASLSAGPGSLQAASCPTDTRCYVTDGSAVQTSADPTGGAATWSAQTVDAGQTLTAIDCPTASECVAGDARGGLLGSTDPTSANWPRVEPSGAQAVTGISCPDAGHCAAVDTSGDALVSSQPTGPDAIWSTSRIDSTGAFSLSAELTAVACTAGQECTATDSYGQVLTSASPFTGGRWGPTLVDADGSCVTAPCVAEALRVHDSHGTRTVDAPAPGTGNAIADVTFSGDTLSWTDAGSAHQLTLH